MTGWRVKPIFQRDPMYVDYVERMVKQMRATIPPQPIKIGQEPSTQRILDRPESEDEAWKKRPMPTWEEARAVPGAKNPYDMSHEELDSFVGRRELDPHDVEIITRLRSSGRGHTFGDAVSEGATCVTPESRERAVNAFVYSQPAELSEEDKKRLTSLTKSTLENEPTPLLRAHGEEPKDWGKPPPKRREKWKLTRYIAGRLLPWLDIDPGKVE